MKTRSKVIVTFSVPGFHAWPAAPKSVEYLASDHRHMFKFRLEAKVEEYDREIEFHTLLAKAQLKLGEVYKKHVSGSYEFGNESCESIASTMLHRVDELCACEVWEDDENGARVERVDPATEQAEWIERERERQAR